MPTAARVPPHWPLEYVAIKLGLNEKTELGNWFNRSDSAGLIEWLYSGLTMTYASACAMRLSKPDRCEGFALSE